LSRSHVALAVLLAALAALPAFAGPYALSVATLILYSRTPARPGT
jgi:hypothetical protein